MLDGAKDDVKGMKSKLEGRVATAAYAIIVMYLFFMILDRLISLILGYNFQPYGSYVPPGFTMWGHLFNGATALFGVWVWLKLWDFVGRYKQRWILRIAVTSVASIPFFWIPYNNDANYLISLGYGSLIPLYVVANVIYVWTGGIVALRLFTSTRWKLVFLLSLFAAFLFIHFVLYAPRFPEFQWT